MKDCNGKELTEGDAVIAVMNGTHREGEVRRGDTGVVTNFTPMPGFDLVTMWEGEFLCSSRSCAVMKREASWGEISETVGWKPREVDNV